MILVPLNYVEISDGASIRQGFSLSNTTAVIWDYLQGCLLFAAGLCPDDCNGSARNSVVGQMLKMLLLYALIGVKSSTISLMKSMYLRIWGCARPKHQTIFSFVFGGTPAPD